MAGLRIRFAASLATAGLLSCAQPGPDLGPLGFVALVPWALANLGPAVRRAALADYAGGLAFFALSTGWLAHVAFTAAAIVIPVSALSFVLAGWLLRRLGGRLPLSLALGLAWMAGEYLRSLCPPGGFPMGLLGAGFYRFTTWIQVADLGGIFLVSFLGAAVNGAAAGLLAPFLRLPRPGAPALEGAIGLVAFLAPLVYGAVRLPRPTSEGPLVTVVQANVSERAKREVQTEGGDAEDRADWMVREHRRLTLSASDPGDLLVWPETMLPWPLGEGGPEQVLVEAGEVPGAPVRWTMRDAAEVEEEIVRREVLGALGERRPYFLVGVLLLQRIDGTTHQFNSALLYTPEGARVGRYDKVHLVPGGEFLPWRRAIPFADAIGRWIESWAGYFPDLAPGEGPRVLEFSGRDGRRWRFGAAICWDNAYADLFRSNARAGADFHVLLSNEAHFLDSFEMEQLLAHAVFRAVETRRSILRATNTGISALVAPDGTVPAVLERQGRRKDVAGTLSARVPVSKGGSLFLRIGEAFPIAASVFALGLAFLCRRGAESPRPS
ncbi:MAG: apolipoprotein N-acyltransferase [Planctomycetes bacterium]|nr:apolipoprotein N-acyltransferase [Planctomycetota bacterium]